MDKDKFIKQASDKFKVDSNYTYKEVTNFLKSTDFPLENATALSVNQWNKGMTEAINIFEKLPEYGMYRFLGMPHSFSGKCFHNPKGVSGQFIIGEWVDGKFSYFDKNISSFKEWKEGGNGKISADLGAKVECHSTTIDKLTINRILTNDVNLTSDKNYVLVYSPLGQLLYGKTIGDIFKFGSNDFIVKNISYS